MQKNQVEKREESGTCDQMRNFGKMRETTIGNNLRIKTAHIQNGVI